MGSLRKDVFDFRDKCQEVKTDLISLADDIDKMHKDKCQEVKTDLSCLADDIDKMHKAQKMGSLRKDLFDFWDKCQEVKTDLISLADDIDKMHKDVSTSKIAGSAAGIVGGSLAIIGFGLSFVTFGASLGLSIAGGVIAGAGGVTVAGATIADAVKSSDSAKRADAAVKELYEIRERLVQDCYEISERLGDENFIATHYPTWTQFWGKLIFGSVNMAWSLSWSVIGNTVRTGLRIADLTVDIAATGGATAFRVLSAGARGLHIAGGVVGILILPLDIYTLVDSATGLAKKRQHAISVKLRETVQKLQDACPDETEIENMLAEVGSGL